MHFIRAFLLGPLLGGVIGSAEAAEFRFECPLDSFVEIPSVWEMTPDDLEAQFSAEDVEIEDNPFFKWLTLNRDRAVFMRQPYGNVEVDLTLFEGTVRVQEVIVDFYEGTVNGITFSIYNRGDGGDIEPADFKERLKTSGRQIGQRLGARPMAKKADHTQGLLTEGWLWLSENGMAVLEHNEEAPEAQLEFLRLKIARRDAKGPFAAAMQSRSGASVRLSELPQNVQRDDKGNVYVGGLPMVDQGPKGYCVVASTARLFEYYGIPCDQHQLAQISGADATKGTSTLAISESLGAIDHRFKTRYEIVAALSTRGALHEVDRDMRLDKRFERGDFDKEIRDHIDDGIPLLWSLELGQFPERPAISPQASGGHMRMIIGYNDDTDEIVFSDSWGAGHEKKFMKAGDAFQATHGLFVLKPTTR